MSKKPLPQPPRDMDRFAAERRRFLSEGVVSGVGAASLLAQFGVSRYAVAQGAAPTPAAAGTGMAAPPPEPAVSQQAPLHDLKGKVAYITASSDGIGLGIARAASAAGMKVCIGYRNEERVKAALPLFKEGNAGVFPIKHDVTDRDGWVKVLEQIKQRYGRLHLVVNNAGFKTFARVTTVSAADWDNAVAVNLTATYNSVAVCLPHMLEHGEGSQIVVTSSMSGLLPGGPLGVYTSTKIAVVGLIEALRVELEGTTVGTSAFCPGGVNTDNYLGTGEQNPFHQTGGLPPGTPRFKGPPPGMDPLEAGERVLNGVVHNDLFILTHPEYMPGTKQRFDAMLASEPPEGAVPPDRLNFETRVLHAGIYRREIQHRKQKRGSFRSVAGPLDRRQFLGGGVAVHAAVRPSMPPEPKVSQPPPLQNLKGKVAYISAASDGIGLGIARAASNAGMIVVIGYRNEERLKAALPLFKPGNAGVLAIKHDVTDRDGWKNLVEQITGNYGKLHLVVNNAGVKTLRQASQAKFDEWDNALAVNFTAIYNSVAACLPHLQQHGEGGHFVTTASMGGLLPGVNAGVYTATKIAAVGIMEALRVELESTNIGTSVFCPGLVATDNYIGSGEENPLRKPAPAGRPSMGALGMDPLEAGERVLNGVVNNDLFILSHPEFKAGMQERFSAILDSSPAIEVPIPQSRIAYEQVVLRNGVYPREIEHRKHKRASYRSV